MNIAVKNETFSPGSTAATLEKKKSVTKRFLVNKLNYMNFQDQTIIINMKHVKYETSISINAKPLPCSGEQLECVWTDGVDVSTILTKYTFSNIVISDKKKLYQVIPEVLDITATGLCLLLPETGREITARKVRRHLCSGITVQVTQNSAMFTGRLVDFNPEAFRIELVLTPPQSFEWIDLDSPLTLHFFSGNEILYSGECRVIRHDLGNAAGNLVLKPVSGHSRRRFRPKIYRSTRQHLIPSPNIVFAHPFTGTTVNLNVANLSGTGFCIEEEEEISVLLPGMIIPEVEIVIAGSLRVRCRAQVVYRNICRQDDAEVLVRCGVAILDMNADDHVKILSMLQQAANKNSSIDTTVDMDNLWNFFFDTGFIYPDKYASFETNKKEIKRTYERLYGQNSHIARHFIYQERGNILGHMAMMRFQEKSWLIHHHAASKSESMKAGVVVLNQIGRFINDSHNMHSTHMNYVLCYFRPNNKFPDRVFGGLARKLKNPKVCSVDTFAYFHADNPEQRLEELPLPWKLNPTEPDDLHELEIFYEHESGGLMLDALDLKSGETTRTLSDQYKSLGFRKECFRYSLKKDGILKAIVIVNISDVCLNMSNLTNCLTVIVLEDDVPRDVLMHLSSYLSDRYEGNEFPVLLYPPHQAMRCSIPTEKLYSLWVLNMQHTDHYFEYLENLIKHIQH